MLRVSIIVPALDEEREIETSLRSLRELAPAELLVVDGGSSDATVAIARRFADHVEITARGRARQLNAGAARATGDVLCFVHVDTRLPNSALGAVERALGDATVVGGAFGIAIRDPRRRYRVIEWGANLRARLTALPYGDQAMFVRREVFARLGGFPILPVLEDVGFALSMRRAGRVVLMDDRVANSPRRWEREGLFYATVRNWVITLLYAGGVPAERLARWYPNVR